MATAVQNVRKVNGSFTQNLSSAEQKQARANSGTGYKLISVDAVSSAADAKALYEAISDKTATPYIEYTKSNPYGGEKFTLVFIKSTYDYDSKYEDYIFASEIESKYIFRKVRFSFSSNTLSAENVTAAAWDEDYTEEKVGGESLFVCLDNKITYDSESGNYSLKAEEITAVTNLGKIPYLSYQNSSVKCFYTREHNQYYVFTSFIDMADQRYWWIAVDHHSYNGQRPDYISMGHELLQSKLAAGTGIGFNTRNNNLYVDNVWGVNKATVTLTQGDSTESCKIKVTGLQNHACNLVDILIPDNYSNVCGQEIDFDISEIIGSYAAKFETCFDVIINIQHRNSSLDYVVMQVNFFYHYDVNGATNLDFLQAEIIGNGNAYESSTYWGGSAAKYLGVRPNYNTHTYKVAVRSGFYHVTKSENLVSFPD